jgi:hypothetical protein
LEGASHCGAMAGYNDVYAAKIKIMDMVATAGITISVNARINLVCSARLDREPITSEFKRRYDPSEVCQHY